MKDSMKNSQLKNHFGTRSSTSRLKRVLSSKFGVNLEQFTQAMLGDVEQIKVIGEMSRQGRMAEEFAPKLAEAYCQIIGGTTAYNKAMADVLAKAGSSATEINKSLAIAALANTKHENSRKELALEYSTALGAEKLAHQHRMSYGQIKGYIDAHIANVDNLNATIEQSRRPELKQLLAQEAYEKKVVNEFLSKGNKAQPVVELSTQKDYGGGRFQEAVSSRIGSIRSALGL